MLNDEVRVPTQLFQVLRQPDVLIVHIGHVRVLLGIATNAVPKGKLQLRHGRASKCFSPWKSEGISMPGNRPLTLRASLSPREKKNQGSYGRIMPTSSAIIMSVPKGLDISCSHCSVSRATCPCASTGLPRWGIGCPKPMSMG